MLAIAKDNPQKNKKLHLQKEHNTNSCLCLYRYHSSHLSTANELDMRKHDIGA